MCLAREALDEYVDDKAVRCCEEAVRLLVRAATVDPAVACLWKLMGEACTIIRDLPEETVEGIMSRSTKILVDFFKVNDCAFALRSPRVLGDFGCAA